MELLDTPNPNAKKILGVELEQSKQNALSQNLEKIDGLASVFFGPGFITIIKDENMSWESLNQDIIDIFDKI